MLYPNFSVYRGEESKSFQGYITENDFFAVFSFEGLSEEDVVGFKENLLKRINERKVSNVAELDGLISEIVKEKNLPAGISLVAGYLKDDVLILKSINGEVFLKRGAGFAKIIESTNSASGHIKEGDFYIFGTSDFSLDIDEDLQEIIRSSDVNKSLEMLSKFKRRNVGTAILLTFQQKIIEEESPAKKPNKLFNLQLDNYKEQLQSVKSKWIYFLAPVFILVAIFGFANRSPNSVEEKKQEIYAELAQAAEVAPVNIETATGLIREADKDLEELKKLTKSKRIISEVEKAIAESKKKTLHADEKSSEEFFDLSLEDKQAKGTQTFLLEDDLYILNPDGAIYKFSLSKKSIDKYSSRDMRNSLGVAATEDAVYFLKSDGVYSYIDKKTKKEIPKSDSWKGPSQLLAYGTNLYVLDQQRKNIFKYFPTDKGFSDGGDYLKPNQEINLGDISSFTIDGAVYLGDDSKVLKFIDGFREAFSFYVPEKVTISKIFTSKELESLYLLDKNQGKIYILSKDGQYQKQVKSDVLKKAQDFVVLDRSAYVFVSPKIYKIGL